MALPTVAVIGAGVAGVVCASTLQQRGFPVQVFEQASTIGGRLGTKASPSQTFDCGAQYFTVFDPRFQNFIKTQSENWLCSPWQGWVVDIELEGGHFSSRDEASERWTGTPHMPALLDAVSNDLTIRLNTRISELERTTSGWRLFDDKGHYIGLFERVILAMPATEAHALGMNHSTILDEACKDIIMMPCWTVLAGFARQLDIPFDGAFNYTQPLAWAARNSSKPGRQNGEHWVLQATPEWSDSHLLDDSNQVITALLDAFESSCQVTASQPNYTFAKLWHHAKVINPLDRDFVYDENLGLAACGDWCLGPRVEAAYISGYELGRRLR